MNRSEYAHGIMHCLPAVAGSAASRKLSELGVRGVFASLFDQRPSPAKSDARTPAHGGQAVRTPKVPPTAGRTTTGENLRKLATASSSCGELRKLLSTLVRISPIPRLSFRAKSRNLSILFPILPLAHDYAALQLLLVGLRSPTPCP